MPVFPPDYNNMKCYYVSEELARRGIDVVWLSLRGGPVSRAREISFANLRIPSLRVLSTTFACLHLAIYCLVNSVHTVYMDAWFYSRDSPIRQLATIITLRALGIKVVVDERDPYLDFEVARGAVRPASLRYRLLRVHEKLTIYTCSIFLLPSKAYERLLTFEGAPRGKVRGIFRGIDLHQFKSSADGAKVRAHLGLGGAFVVGWFGMMYPHRQVKEVLIPLAQTIDSLIPNGRMIIGGKGPLEQEVEKAARVERSGHFVYVGAIPYSDLPGYLAACDLLLCPINVGSRFAGHSNWLKIIEGLAVGVPVIATKTETTNIDLAHVKGVVWTGPNLSDFQTSVKDTYGNLAQVKEEANVQTNNLLQFGIESTIPKLVDWVLQP
jgi:glycosyltransferase involved in cell wall biosynthesis